MIEAYNDRDLQTEADILAPGHVAHVPSAPGPLDSEAWTQASPPSAWASLPTICAARREPFVWAYISLAAVILGAVLWDGRAYLRAVDSEEFVEGRLIGWLFPAYALLTQVGLLAFGVSYLRAGYPAWLGGVTVGGAIIFFIVYFVLKDIPPFFYYILTFMAGVRLMR